MFTFIQKSINKKSVGLTEMSKTHSNTKHRIFGKKNMQITKKGNCLADTGSLLNNRI